MDTLSSTKEARIYNGLKTERKVQCYEEQYCIGTWNVRPMNQGKLEVVKQDGKSEHRHFSNQ